MSQNGTVVGWDGSPAADEALEWAAEREQRRRGSVRIVRVLDGNGGGDPGRQVAQARTALEEAVAAVGRRRADLETSAELLVGDPVAELGRAAGRDRLLVLGASRIGRARRPEARRIPIALAGRSAGTTVVVPAGWEQAGSGVVAVVSRHGHSAATIEFAAAAAAERGEALTVVRLHDPHDLEIGGGAPHIEEELERLHARLPGLQVRLDPGWVSSPYGLLARSDAASLLVLEGGRPSAAPPSYSFERWLAGHARSPFAVVSRPSAPPAATGDETRAELVLAV